MKNKKPRIALLDLETAPIEAFVWGIQGPQFISLNQIIKDWAILSYTLKFLGEDKVYYNDNRNKKDPRDDKHLVKELHKLLSGVDVLITQNGDRFDWKKFQARVIYHGLERLPKPKSYDTYKVGKKEFGFTSHKLEYMCEHLGLKNKKLKSKKFAGMDLWRACLNKNVAAWKEMELYNKQDVFALEDLYLIMRPYGPAMDHGLHNTDDRGSCPTCGSSRLISRGTHNTKTGTFAKYVCKDCRSWSIGKENLITLDERKEIKKKL